MNPPSPETVIALIQKDLQNIAKNNDEIKQSIKEMAGVFVNNTEFVGYKKLVESDLIETKKQQEENKTRLREVEVRVWMAMGALAVITFGLKFFIK